MTTAINKTRLNNLANEIWKSAERLRGKFKAYEYQSVILPIIVIRRLECILIEWRKKKAEEIRRKRPDIKDKELEKLVKNLELNPKEIPFSNKTKWTLQAITKEDPTLIEKTSATILTDFPTTFRTSLSILTTARLSEGWLKIPDSPQFSINTQQRN